MNKYALALWHCIRTLACPAGIFGGILLCAAGWAAPLYNPGTGHYYEAVPGVMTWDAARIAAQSRQYLGAPGHLVTITSATENQFLVANFPGAVAGGYWLGGFQPDGITDSNTGWQWVTGEPWSYTNWSPGEPNDFFGPQSENRLQLWPFNSEGTWNDFPPTAPANIRDVEGYVVEYEPTPTQAIQSIITLISTLVNQGVLSPAEANGLIAKLVGALQKLNGPGIASVRRAHITATHSAAINQLQAFIHQVEAFVHAGKLTPAQGQELIAPVQAIIVQLGG